MIVGNSEKTMAQIQIRTATPDDVGEISKLSGQFGYPGADDQFQDRLKLLLSSREHTVLVAGSDSGSLVGWIHLFIAQHLQSSPFVEIGGLVVSEQHRRQGVGKRLLMAAESWALEQGMSSLRVRSRRERGAAKAFYEGMGFVVTKEQRICDKTLGNS